MTGEGIQSPCPKSLFYELMEFTCEISQKYAITPFSFMEQDKDRVIMLINYYIEKGENGDSVNSQTIENSNEHGIRRVRVDDKTATGGWW